MKFVQRNPHPAPQFKSPKTESFGSPRLQTKPKTPFASRNQDGANDGATVEFIITLVAMTTGIAIEDIRSPSRNHARAARARQMAMYLAYVTYSWSLTRIGEGFGRDRTTASHACRTIEDMRDDKAFDATLSELESCLQTAPKALACRLTHWRNRQEGYAPYLPF